MVAEGSASVPLRWVERENICGGQVHAVNCLGQAGDHKTESSAYRPWTTLDCDVEISECIACQP